MNSEICHSVIEASLFPAIQNLLVLVYRCKNYSEEVAMAKNMCQHVNATPKDLSVRRKFWLLSQVRERGEGGREGGRDGGIKRERGGGGGRKREREKGWDLHKQLHTIS